MFIRLLLALLLAVFASPVAATNACHDAEARMRVSHSTPAAPDHKAVAHACIGCVPPSDRRHAPVAVPVALPAARPVFPAPRPLTGQLPAPDLRPPRTA